MMRSVVLAIPLLLAVSGRADDKEPVRSIERLDPRLDKLIPKDAKMEKLAGGFAWSEGPVWVAEGGYLLFSDIPNNRIVKWQEGKGTSDYMKPAGYTGDRTDLREPGTNGLALDHQGRLLMCEHGDRRLSRQEKDGKKTTLAHKYMDKRLNSPNDLAVKSNGDIYFTDPPYGRMVKDKIGFPDRDLDFCGVYRLAKDGTLTLLTKEMSKPNGIAFSPDEKTLYVANSDPLLAIWKKFPVKEDGTLGEGKVFFDATKLISEERVGLPDGLKVDKDGNLFATGPGGVLIFAADGRHLGTLMTSVPTANCNWGDDGSVLYIAANHDLLRIKTSTRGAKK